MLGSFFMADTASVIVHDLDVVRIAINAAHDTS
jgi:hypothetical protein